jgi:hypothetical protein
MHGYRLLVLMFNLLYQVEVFYCDDSLMIELTVF